MNTKTKESNQMIVRDVNLREKKKYGGAVNRFDARNIKHAIFKIHAVFFYY